MSKELIVSLNGREKKIAIIENGKVTEFYIERGEGSQGIVGNIYKGRVMRVLPGMQSAFVDIGLERDAFLYVSDFFDEEEEYEQIVVERPKGAAAADAPRGAERGGRGRPERQDRGQSAPALPAYIEEPDEYEQAEPDEFEADEAEHDSADDFAVGVEAPATEAEPAAPTEQPVAAAESTEETEAGGRRKRRRRGGRGGSSAGEQGAGEQSGAPSAARAAAATGTPLPPFAREVEARRGPRVEADTPFALGGTPFERVIDDDAAGEGEMFKDARLQERISDQIRGVEFDMAETPVIEVGTLLAANAMSGGAQFERVADEDDDAGSERAVAAVQPAVAASVASLAHNVADVAPTTAGTPQTFERISDDEPGPATAAKGKSASKAPRSRRAAKGQTAAPAETPAAPTAGDTPVADAATETGAPKRKRSSSSGSSSSGTTKTATKGTTKKGAAKKAAGSSSSKGGARRGKAAADGAAADDAEASVRSKPTRGEFARRGGRRRSRRPKDENENGEAQTNGHAEEAEPLEVAPVAAAAVEDVPERVERAPRGGGRGRDTRGGRGDSGSSGGGRGDGGRTEGRADSRGEGRGDNRGDSRGDNRSDNRSDSRGDSRGDGRSDSREGRDTRERGSGRGRHTPLITDLLREGQEVLVQIAKEPIAAKGARITSHIALPGRFLVYMPTVEHVGVSRKIESDSERVRLRKLIKDIRETEDVPSGGFIVRTAGTGITEQDLRDDARYLVRTWRDIRRAAEKQKAPALVHKDLDLVQRILRDQLSEDFTAIRVDSEEEYLEIVEFINRIQPRLVNRVKLYTREEPILEAFGVQGEIEKAIKPRVWLKSGGYLVINQTEALVAIDVNTGKFVGRGGTRLEDTITRTNLEAVDEIARQIRLRDLGGILVLDLIDMDERRNRARVMQALQDALRDDKSPTKVLSFNDFGLVIMTRKRVKQSLERTLCSPCPYCEGAGLIKSPQTVCYEILEEARRLARNLNGELIKQTTLRVNPEVARTLRASERDVLTEIEDYLGAVDITSDTHVKQDQFDFAVV